MNTKTRTFRPKTIEKVRGSGFPSEWLRRTGISATDVVNIVIRADYTSARARLRSIMDQASDEAAAKGLTEEKLDTLMRW